MNISIYSPHPWQHKVHEDPSRFKVLNCGRRAGKSTLAQNYIICPGIPEQMSSWPLKGALQKPGGRFWIVAPTYTQAKSVYWRGLMFSKDPANTTAIPKPLIKEINNSELIITLVNDSMIELKGADNPDSLRGAEADGVIMDEYAFWSNPDAWEYVIRPMLSTTGGWAMFISTPNGYNHFYEMAEYAQQTDGWGYHKATILDNFNIPEEEKAQLQKDLDEDTYAQEYMAEFRKMKGLVYPEFDGEIHVFDPTKNPPPLGGTYGMGIDPGTSNALAAVFFFIDHDDNWYLLDEVYQRGMDTEKAARLIQQKMGTNYYSYKVADQAAAQFILDMNALHNLGITGQKKTKDAIQEGIRLCRQQLKVREGTGKPKLFVANHCRNFIREIESYRYPEKSENKNEPEDPIKENDHLMDAWRYLRLNVFYPTSKPKLVREKIYSDVTGRVIGYKEART